MKHLAKGLHKFQEEVFRDRHELFERLSHGQRPDTLFITCSDSRIDPNLLTQTSPGDLFILRNAGNLIPAHNKFLGAEAATIEYAVSALKVQDIIVCGHTQCGAMRALVGFDSVDSLPAMKNWLSHAEQTGKILQKNYSQFAGPDLLLAAVKENVLVQLESLRSHPAVDDALKSGALRLHGWVYEIETGHVAGFDPETESFTYITEGNAREAGSRLRREGPGV